MTTPQVLCAYCEEQPAIVQCGDISDAWEGAWLCAACWGFVLADPDEPRLADDAPPPGWEETA